MDDDRLALRLYQSYRVGRGIRLSRGELRELILGDDALATRVANAVRGDSDSDWSQVAILGSVPTVNKVRTTSIDQHS